MAQIVLYILVMSILDLNTQFITEFTKKEKISSSLCPKILIFNSDNSVAPVTILMCLLRLIQIAFPFSTSAQLALYLSSHTAGHS